MLFEGDLVHRFLAPLEGSGLGIVNLDESIDGLADLTRVGEAGAFQDGPCHDAEPDLDLIEPTGVRGGEVEMDVGMTPEPAVVLGFVCVEVVEDDMERHVFGIVGDEVVHEVQELPAAPSRVVTGFDEPADVRASEEVAERPLT